MRGLASRIWGFELRRDWRRITGRIEIAAANENVGDRAHGDRALAHLAQPLKDRKL